MTKLEKLYNDIDSSDTVYFCTQSIKNLAKTVRVKGTYGIIINESVYSTDAERLVALAHEKGMRAHLHAACDASTG